MFCSTCGNETDSASLFCHVCDTYRAAPAAGKKANVGARLAAHFIDVLVAFTIFMTIGLVSCGMAGIGAAGVSPGGSDSQNMAFAGLGATLGFGTFFLAIAGYIGLLLFFLARGKTPGKALFGLRVADKRNGNLPGVPRMLLRETLGKFVSGFFLALGYFWAIFDRDAQAWHDKIAGTVVLKVDPAPASHPSPVLASGSDQSAVLR
jgi:uncharacterized RDD family membrane protein YckC